MENIITFVTNYSCQVAKNTTFTIIFILSFLTCYMNKLWKNCVKSDNYNITLINKTLVLVYPKSEHLGEKNSKICKVKVVKLFALYIEPIGIQHLQWYQTKELQNSNANEKVP